jgi:hypothetical protein
MNILDLKELLSNMGDDYLYLGKTNKTVNQFSSHKDKQSQLRRQSMSKKNERLTREEKITSTSNGLLCQYILGLINRLES